MSECLMSEWISTKKQLPPDAETVLLFYRDKHKTKVVTGHWDPYLHEFVQEAMKFFELGVVDELFHKKKYVPYWMPLPELPE